MAKIQETFNRSGFSRFLNGPGGRVFRAVAGMGFLIVGFAFRAHVLGVASMVWGILALSAGVLDICFFSAVLGGPLSGPRIRARYQSDRRP